MTVSASLEGKTAVVTGASSGIGRAIASRLAIAGARTYLVGRTASAMEQTRAAVADAGGNVEIVIANVRDLDEVRRIIARAADDTGRLDLMINNAGVGYHEPIHTGTDAHWREMFEVNVLALLAGTQAAVAAMRRFGGGGHIVNVSSLATRGTTSGVYGATKAAVNYLSEGLRQELENDNIRVTCLIPGVTATNFARNWDASIVNGIGALAGVELDWSPGDRIPDSVLDAAQVSLDQHIARPEDIAEAVLHVVSLPLRLNIPEIVVRPAKQLQF